MCVYPYVHEHINNVTFLWNLTSLITCAFWSGQFFETVDRLFWHGLGFITIIPVIILISLFGPGQLIVAGTLCQTVRFTKSGKVIVEVLHSPFCLCITSSATWTRAPFIFIILRTRRFVLHYFVLLNWCLADLKDGTNKAALLATLAFALDIKFS